MNNMTKFLLITTTVGIFALVTPKAYGLAPMSAQELSNLCESYSDDVPSDKNIQCVRYIKGFIDGILAIKQNGFSLDKADKPSNSFVERAIKTRIGNRIKTQEPLYTKQFCLGDDPSFRAIVDNVAKEINHAAQQDSTALIAVYRALSQNFPCEKTG